MSRAFAAGTSVAASKTQGEVTDMLCRRGVNKIATMVDGESFTLAFEFETVAYRVTLPLPDPEDDEFSAYQQGSVWKTRTPSATRERYEAELNRRWRAFGMVIKGKLIAVEEGISTMQAEFIGNAILSTGKTVAETHAGELGQLSELGQLPALALTGRQGK